MSTPFSLTDICAIVYFLLSWVLIGQLTERELFGRKSLSLLMAGERRRWMERLRGRELRIVDIAIIAGLQNGTAFFASSCLLAIGGCFAMFSATGEIEKLYTRFLSDADDFQPLVWELKLLGLAALFAYSFFKFGWAYRLFNYCSVIIGNVPFASDQESEECFLQSEKAASLNIIAARHFNSGLRTVFFSIAYIGWFIGPLWLMAASMLTSFVLVRRQYFSRARETLLPGN